MVRRSKLNAVNGAGGIHSGFFPSQTAASPPPSVRPEISASLSDMSLYGDFAVIDFSGRAESLALESEDEIHVPAKEHFVYVSGHVRNPGAYPYKEGKDLRYYVKQARGYTPKADPANQVVMFQFKNIRRLKEGSNLSAGDIIVVPASVENKKLSTVYLPIFQSVIGALSVLLAIFAVTK